MHQTDASLIFYKKQWHGSYAELYISVTFFFKRVTVLPQSRHSVVVCNDIQDPLPHLESLLNLQKPEMAIKIKSSNCPNRFQITDFW